MTYINKSQALRMSEPVIGVVRPFLSLKSDPVRSTGEFNRFRESEKVHTVIREFAEKDLDGVLKALQPYLDSCYTGTPYSSSPFHRTRDGRLFLKSDGSG